MNVGCVPKVCKSNDPFELLETSVDCISFWDSGKRVSNTWITCLKVMNSSSKDGIIHDSLTSSLDLVSKVQALQEGSASYQLVGEVIAHQG